MKDFKSTLNEQTIKRLLIFFGSFNPPTKGHQVLFDKLKFYKRLYKIHSCTIYVDSIVNNVKPLDYDTKLPFIRKIIPSDMKLSTKQYDSLYDIVKDEISNYDEIYIVSNSNKILDYSKIEKLGEKYNMIIRILSSDSTSADTNSVFVVNSRKTISLIKQGRRGSAIMTLPDSLDINDKNHLYELLQDAIK